MGHASPGAAAVSRPWRWRNGGAAHVVQHERSQEREASECHRDIGPDAVDDVGARWVGSTPAPKRAVDFAARPVSAKTNIVRGQRNPSLELTQVL